jgi:formylglycine-generating enzyme required for sulfatase activity
MSIRLAVALLVGLPWLIAGCGEDNPPPTGPPPAPEIIISDDAVFVDEFEDVHLVLADSTSLRFAYSGSPPALAPGQVLMGSEQGGYLRRVTSVETQDTLVIVETEPAALSDVVEEGTIRINVLLDPSSGQGLRKGSPELKNAVPGVALTSDGIDFSGTVLFDGGAGGQNLRVVVENGSVAFVPEFDLECEYVLGWPPVRSFHAIANGDFDAVLDIAATATGGLEFRREIRLGEIWFPNVAIAGIPGVADIFVAFDAGFEADFSSEMSLEFGAAGGLDIDVGARYEAGAGWETVWERTLSFEDHDPQWGASADLELRGYIKTSISMRLLGSAGPYIAAEPYLDFTETFLPPPCAWATHAGARGVLGFEVSIFGWELVDYDTDLADVRIELASGQCGDLAPPAAVTDLAAGSPTATSLRLSWTAVGDDGMAGRASAYDIRYATSASTAWEQMTRVTGELPPRPAGEAESFTVTGLSANTTYRFRMKVADEVHNWSWESNEASGRTRRVDEPQMVVVPAGTFMMGDGVAYCGTEEHQVTLTRDFYLSQHEVTNQDYLEAVQWAYANGYVTVATSYVRDNLDGSTEELLDLESQYSEIQFDQASETFYLREVGYALQYAYPEGYDPSDHPVKEVTWYGSVRYCDWMSLREGLLRAYEHSGDWACNGGDPHGAAGYRLPTDAEWEYAAQFDDERIYPWGNESPDCSRANFYDNGYCVRWTSPVGSYPAGHSGLGLWDMAGNVWEWCNDWGVCSLGTSPVTDPVGLSSGTGRLLRGGRWSSYVNDLRCAYRLIDISYPWNSYINVGFRAARTVTP